MLEIIVPHLREMAPPSITGELRRNFMCRRIHAVAELPYRCFAPMSERQYRPLLVLLILHSSVVIASAALPSQSRLDLRCSARATRPWHSPRLAGSLCRSARRAHPHAVPCPPRADRQRLPASRGEC